jgi:hypothetical protein
VRLCDLIEPKQATNIFWAPNGCFSPSGLTSSVCDGALIPQTIVELGGSQRQKERDEFVHAALQAAEYKVIRMHAINPDELEGLLAAE